MPNPLQPYLNPARAVDAYRTIRKQIGHDHILFSAMQQVSQRRGFAFDLPASPAEYTSKHEEVEQYLTRYQALLDRQGLFFELVEEIQHQLRQSGQAVHAERLSDLVVLETNQDFQIKISTDGAWLVGWRISDAQGLSDAREVVAVTYESSWDQIVPWPVVQYLNSGILLYKQRAYATALALMSIAVEATLRDLLSTKGYSFTPGASKVDIYDCSHAQIASSGNSYSLTFLDAMPLGPADLATSASGAVPVDVQIRRNINLRKNRVDLLMRVPPYLVDHLSTNQIVQQGIPKGVDGLGEALRIARDVEKVITPGDLPPDVDVVLKAVRNNLIHLSSDSMRTELPRYASRSNTGQFTVKDFVNEADLVFDLVADIPDFVNKQYVKLWHAELHI